MAAAPSVSPHPVLGRSQVPGLWGRSQGHHGGTKGVPPLLPPASRLIVRCQALL